MKSKSCALSATRTPHFESAAKSAGLLSHEKCFSEIWIQSVPFSASLFSHRLSSATANR
jgi:hypothetical protein